MYYTDIWKSELRRLADDLNLRQTQYRWSRKSEARTEVAVITGFYIVRKLIDAEAIDPKIGSDPIAAVAFPSKGKKVSRMKWPTVDEYFNLSKPGKTSLPVRTLCGYIVHSHLFTPWFSTRGRLLGFFVASDRTVKRQVYCISAQHVVDLFSKVARERVPNQLLRFGPEENRIVM